MVEINRAVADGEANVSVMQRAVQHKVLPSGLREHFSVS